ncbi:MAG: hypothetical protein IH927_07025 [Proteobacteria bacterium]|nr:hypothetical protein [Pseudomonadota bacterium]
MYADPHIISSLSAAAAAAVLFLLGSKIWVYADTWLRAQTPFASMIKREAVGNYHKTLKKMEASINTHAAAFAVAVFVFLSIFFFASEPWYSPLDNMSWWMVFGFLSALLVMEIVSLIRLQRSRFLLAKQFDARVTAAQGLQVVATKGNHIFHSIAIGDELIDHVVVGSDGIYAVHVLVRNPKKHGTVNLRDNKLLFGKNAPAYSLDKWNKTLKAFATILNGVLGHPVRVMSVIAVPGWLTGDYGSDRHLIANQDNLITLTGWKHADAYLMNDDVEKVKHYLEMQ